MRLNRSVMTASIIAAWNVDLPPPRTPYATTATSNPRHAVSAMRAAVAAFAAVNDCDDDDGDDEDDDDGNDDGNDDDNNDGGDER